MIIRSSTLKGTLNFILTSLISFLTFIVLASPSIYAAPSDVDFSFGSKVVDAATIDKAAVQPDGKVLLAGGFDVIVSQPTSYMIRLNTDGTRDYTFQSAAPGRIDDFVLQPDGKIVVVGRFSYGGSTCNSFNQCYGIMRLNVNGSYDATFKSGITPGGSQFVNTVVLQPDGKFIIGGQFSTYGGQPRGLVARINADGTLDTTFQDPNVNNGGFGFSVNALALQTDGKVLIGGSFDTVSGQARRSIARINADGTLDVGFQATIPGTTSSIVVNVIAIQPDGKILVGGRFTQPNPGRNNGIVRLNADGTLDAAFQTPNYTDYTVSKILLQADGKIFLDGAFPSVGGNTSVTKARLNANGVIDATFNLNGVLRDLYAVTLQSNGRLLVIGTFTAPINNDTSIDYFIVREISLDNAVNAIAVQTDGKILIGGVFTSVTGRTRKGLARLNQNGTLDATFPDLNPTFAGDASISGIRKIVAQPDGKIIVIGSFTNIAGQARINLARFNSDGTLDTGFTNPTITYAFSGYLSDVALQSDGKIIIAGIFSAVGGQAHNSIARLNSNGTIDSTLINTLPSAFGIKTIAVQTDGKIIIGGNFPIANQVNRGIARLNADGTLDGILQNTVVSNTGTNDGTVNVVRIQPDGKILLGGLFATVGGAAHKFLARINADGTLDTSFQDTVFTGSNGIYTMALQADGKILVSGDFFTAGGQPRNGFARINANGSVDTTFGDTGALVNPVSNALAVQRDGKILVGGSFQLISQRVQPFITRLLGTPIFVLQNTLFDFDGDGKADVSVFRPSNGAWYLNQSTAGFTGINFGLSTDKLVPADYDGDGKTDVAVFRNGTWYLQRSSLGFTGIQFGAATDIPVPADFDGDGKAELAVFRPSNGTWYLYNLTTNQTSAVQFGQTGDKPVPADFDGDGKTDIAVYRGGTWYIQRSQLGFTGISFGDANDKPVPADFDGDGKSDVAVFRPSNGTWYLNRSQLGFTGIAYGLGTDLPVAADYDGDGKTDVAVFRNGFFYILQSGNSQTAAQQFGAASDIPVDGVYVNQ